VQNDDEQQLDVLVADIARELEHGGGILDAVQAAASPSPSR
jgi:hypothetical protein